MQNQKKRAKSKHYCIIALFAVVTCLFFVVPVAYSLDQEESSHIYFVQITDTHYNEPGSEE